MPSRRTTVEVGSAGRADVQDLRSSIGEDRVDCQIDWGHMEGEAGSQRRGWLRGTGVAPHARWEDQRGGWTGSFAEERVEWGMSAEGAEGEMGERGEG